MDYLDPVAASDDGFDFSFLSSTASSASSYSPHSTGTSAGLPTEEDIFSLMGGACSDIDGANTVFDGLESWLEGKLDMDGVDGGNASFGSLGPNDFLSMDPFFDRSGAPSSGVSTSFGASAAYDLNATLLESPVAAARSADTTTPGIPSFVLSHIANNPDFLTLPHPPSPAEFAAATVSTSPSLPAAQPVVTAQPSPPPAAPATLFPTPSSTLSKRKFSDSDEMAPSSEAGSSPSGSEQQQPTPAPAPSHKKGAKVSDHNAIERKYRDNINDGFTRLRDSVPCLRVLFGTSTPITMELDTPSPTTGLIDGMPRESKQGKATVLGAAREYIWLLQRERARLERCVVFLDAQIDEQANWREAFERSEQNVQLSPYFQSITFNDGPDSPSSSDSARPPPRKKAKALTAASKKQQQQQPSVKAELVADSGKVLLALGVSFGLFRPEGMPSTETSDVAVSGGKVLGMTRRAMQAVRTKESSSSHAWEVLLGLVIFALVAPVLWKLTRRALGRSLSSRVVLEEEGEERRSPQELKTALGVPTGIIELSGALFGEWVKARLLGSWRPRVSVDEMKVWERVVESELSLPTDLRSYFSHLYTYTRLSSIHSFHPADPQTLAVLSLASTSLAGGVPSMTSLSLWSKAKAAQAALYSGPSSSSDALAELLSISLVDVLAICPSVFLPSLSSPPLTAISAALSTRDILHVWHQLFTLFAPTSLHARSLPIPDHLLSSSSTIGRPASKTDRNHKLTRVKQEIASLVSTTLPGSRAHELALVSMAGWAFLASEETAWKWAVGRLLGEELRRDEEEGKVNGTTKGLGSAARELLRLAGSASSSLMETSAAASASAVGDQADVFSPCPSLSSPEGIVENQINALAVFLLGYTALVRSLPTASRSDDAQASILPRTLRLRALLSSLEAAVAAADTREGDDGEPAVVVVGVASVDEDAKELYVDALYALGRWAVGWKSVGHGGEDSGFSEGD